MKAVVMESVILAACGHDLGIVDKVFGELVGFQYANEKESHAYLCRPEDVKILGKKDPMWNTAKSQAQEYFRREKAEMLERLALTTNKLDDPKLLKERATYCDMWLERLAAV